MKALVFSATKGFRHDSIPAGIAAVTELGREHGFAVTATEDPAGCADLRPYQVVVFLNTSGDVLDDAGRAGLTAFLGRGGGFVGVHCAAHTEPGWPAFAELLGTRFAGHPEVQPATIVVEDADHPATAHLGPMWTRVDEWYDFVDNPRGRVRVLLRMDPDSYRGAGTAGDHPVAWCRATSAGGRSFYTALGHTVESYAEPAMRAHLAGAITWAGGLSG